MSVFGRGASAVSLARKALEDPIIERHTVSGMLRGKRVRFSGAVDYDWFLHVVAPMAAIAIDIYEPTKTTGWHYPRNGGDAFDKSFAVDAVPEQAALSLLTDELRARIIALGPNRITVTPDGVRLDKRYASYQPAPDDVGSAIELAVDLADRVQSQFGQSTFAGHPFRSDMTQPQDDALPLCSEEIRDAFKRQQQRYRLSVPQILGIILSLALVILAGISG